MHYGTVVTYFDEKGFGFIQRDRGADVFFHVSVVAGETPPDIKPGQPVQFELMRREDEPPGVDRPAQPKASLVNLIDRLPGGKLSNRDVDSQYLRHARARHKKPTWRR